MIAALVFAAAIAIPPRPTDYVTDYAGALGPQAARRIETELRTYEQVTKHHVIVWIGQTTGDTPLEDWTIHAAEQWKIGRKGVDDGVILFLFMRDHKVRIEVGYGLESALTDASAGAIIRNTIVPRMRAGDVDGAVQGGTDRILQTITPSFAVQTPISNAQSVTTGIVVFVVLLGFIVLFVTFITVALIIGHRRGTWYSGGADSAGWSGGGGSGGGGSDGGSSGGSFGGGGASGSW